MESAFVFVQVDGESTDVHALHDSIHAVAGVKTVHLVSGKIDFIVYVDATDKKALMDTIMNIRKLKGVSNTDSQIVFPL
jgi:nitrate reductase NapAB chaperone NapD